MVPPPPPPPRVNNRAWNAKSDVPQSTAQTRSHQLHPNQYQTQSHRVAYPYPPPPNSAAAAVSESAAPHVQSVSVNYLPANNPTTSKVSFRSANSDSKSTGTAKNLNSLSPKLRAFFHGTNNNQCIRRNVENYSETSHTGRNNDVNEESDHIIFSPTHLLDESDGSSITLLHSIFSPKFHAQSAKKKKRSNTLHQQHQEHEFRGDHQSMFSPMSNGSTILGRTDDDADDSAVSEMSDEFSTIHAILRGETIQNIKKSAGLDEANHPLQPRTEGSHVVRIGTSKSNIVTTKEDVIDRHDTAIECGPSGKLSVQNPHDDNDSSIVDDSTENMLHQARLLSSKLRNQAKESSSSSHRDQHIIFASPPGDQQYQSTDTSLVTKTPKVTPPTCDDEFYTPSTSDKPDRPLLNDMNPRLSSMAPYPMALNYDLAIDSITDGVKKGLAPVLEEEEWKVEVETMKNYRDDQVFYDSNLDVTDFCTPKQQGFNRQANEYNYGIDNDDEEEFFSPLVLHSGSNQQHGHNSSQNIIMNTVHSSLTALEFSSESMMHDNNGQSAASHLDAHTFGAQTSTEDRIKNDETTSFLYTDVKQELQSLLKEAKILTPPNKSRNESVSKQSNNPSSQTQTPLQTSMYLTYSHDASSLQSPTSFHLHSPSVSNLPPDALTVDFVKACDCTKTLQAILGLLSDDTTSAKNKNNGKRGKQLRYPSLVRLVEKRLQKMLKEQDELAKLDNEHSLQPPSNEADKENVDPIALLNQDNRVSAINIAQENNSSFECVSVLNDYHEVGSKNDESMNRSGLMSMTKSSLDMNLSESMFMLEDESFYWKQGVEKTDAAMKCDSSKSGFIADQRQDRDTQTIESDGVFKSNEELNDLRASPIRPIQNKAETCISPNFHRTTEQITQQRKVNTSDNRLHETQINEFERINHTLRDKVQCLHQQINHLNLTAESTTRQLQSELEEAKHQHSRLFQDKEKLEHELHEIRSMYENTLRETARLKLLLEKRNDGENAEKIQRVIESAKLANKALANALAVSEKDLADACAAKEKSERECNALRDRSNKLEDKASFLLSEVKKVTEELNSSHAYIDNLYASLEASRVRSQEMMKDFQRREKEWIESEKGFSQRIEELESQIGSDSKHKVSMDAYLSVVKQTRHYKFEAMKCQQTINLLKDQLEVVQKSTAAKKDAPANRVPMIIETSRQFVLNDENLVPSNVTPMEQIEQCSSKIDATGMQQQGKQLNRIDVVRAAGGRRGLSEQLKKARRFKQAAK